MFSGKKDRQSCQPDSATLKTNQTSGFPEMRRTNTFEKVEGTGEFP